MDAGGGLCCHPDPPAAHFVCCAHRRGALGCGCVVSGHVPQSHGFAGSSWRIDRRVLWCCVGNSAWRKLRCDYGGVVPLRSCGCGTDVSCRAAEPYALESGDGAGGRDGRLAVFRRNVVYQARRRHERAAARNHLLADGCADRCSFRRSALCHGSHFVRPDPTFFFCGGG